jgi:hypothetical protein
MYTLYGCHSCIRYKLRFHHHGNIYIPVTKICLSQEWATMTWLSTYSSCCKIIESICIWFPSRLIVMEAIGLAKKKSKMRVFHEEFRNEYYGSTSSYHRLAISGRLMSSVYSTTRTHGLCAFRSRGVVQLFTLSIVF